MTTVAVAVISIVARGMRIAVERYQPVAELVVEEMTMTTTVAFDVGVWSKMFQTASRAR